MKDYVGKKILFIGIGYFDYDKKIIHGFEKLGAKVSYFCSVDNNLAIKILIWLKLNYFVKIIRSYIINYKIKNESSSLDYIFIIKCECFRKRNFTLFKTKFANIPTSVYLWDSYGSHINISLIMEYFKGHIFTFDKFDAHEHNLIFRPLFFTEHMNINKYPKFDISFVGSYHSDRYEILLKIKEELIKRGMSYYFSLRTGHIRYLKERFIKKKIKPQDSNLFSTHSISYENYLNIIKKSNVILDIESPLQTGLTIRTIEAIGSNRKILTTNHNIEKYEEISSKLYHVFNRNLIDIDWSFFKKNIPKYNDTSYFYIDTFLLSFFN